MIKNIYFNIICLFIVVFVICLYSEKIVNKYSYENGKNIKSLTSKKMIYKSK